MPGRGPDEPEREFFARLYYLDWSQQERLCLYAGNSQGGPKQNGQSDSVIAGWYGDYAVNGTFSEAGYKFGLFSSEDCV